MWSRERWRHVTPKGQTREPNTLRLIAVGHISKTTIDGMATIANY